MERFSAILKGDSRIFYRIWQSLLDHFPSNLVDLLQKRHPHTVSPNFS